MTIPSDGYDRTENFSDDGLCDDVEFWEDEDVLEYIGDQFQDWGI